MDDRTAPNYRLSVLSDKGEYASGEPIQVAVTIKNVSDGPAYISLGAPLISFYKIAVRAPVPEWTHWALEAAPIHEAMRRALANGSAAWRPLDASKETSQYVDLSAFYDLTEPGKYCVTFSREAAVKRNDPARVHLVSNEIAFTVLPKQP